MLSKTLLPAAIRSLAVILLLSLPLISGARHWRIQASGGIATLGMIGGAKQVQIGIPNPGGQAYNSYLTTHIPDEKSVFPAFGVALMRRSGNLEIGLQLETVTPRSVEKGEIGLIDSNGLSGYSRPYRITGYVGRPVIPVTAICNYYPGPKRGNAFIGLHAGVAYAAGRDQANFNEMPAVEVIDIYYQDAWGFSGGVQAGYRKEIGPLDLGFMLQLKYMHFNLRHGSEEGRYRTQLVVLPVQLYLGYRFGRSKTKSAPEPDAARD